MDPQVALDEIMVALRKQHGLTDDEREELADNLANLSEWIKRGGFVPSLRVGE